MSYDYLSHHGVPGMKWGVRKAASTSGSTKKVSSKKKTSETLTKKGTSAIKRISAYSKNNKAVKAAKEKAIADEKAAKKKKKLKDMNDDELKEAISRLELEKKYKDLADGTGKTKGKKFATEVIEQIGKNTLTNIGTQAANHALGVAINKAFKVDSGDSLKRIVNPQKGQSDKK